MPGRKASKPPRPPFVEPGFYFADRSTEEAFFLVVDHLLDRGATLTGEALVGQPGSADEVADLTYHEIDRVVLHTRDELSALRESGGRTIAGVTLSGVEPGSSGRDVQVRVLPIPDAAVGRDRHPIAIWCDGRAFEPDATSAARKRAAADVLELFTSAVAALSPSYAAILFEWPLPSPDEVNGRPDGFEFADCYLATDYVGTRQLRKLSSLLDGAYRTDLEHGTLFLTSGVFAQEPDAADKVRTQAALAVAARS